MRLRLAGVMLGMMSLIFISTILEKKYICINYCLLFMTCLEMCNAFGAIILSLKLSSLSALIFCVLFFLFSHFARHNDG